MGKMFRTVRIVAVAKRFGATDMMLGDACADEGCMQ